jgi:hypothetical protein
MGLTLNIFARSSAFATNAACYFLTQTQTHTHTERESNTYFRAVQTNPFHLSSAISPASSTIYHINRAHAQHQSGISVAPNMVGMSGMSRQL